MKIVKHQQVDVVLHYNYMQIFKIFKHILLTVSKFSCMVKLSIRKLFFIIVATQNTDSFRAVYIF